MRCPYMLDTDVCSYLIKGIFPRLNEQIKKHSSDICMSSITLAELLYGAQEKGSSKIADHIACLQMLVEVKNWNSEAAQHYSIIRAELEKSGSTIGNMDMLIAASALAEDAVLVTNNTTHFSRISNLRIQNWVNGE